MKKYISISLIFGFLIVYSQNNTIGSLEFLDPAMEELIDEMIRNDLKEAMKEKKLKKS